MKQLMDILQCIIKSTSSNLIYLRNDNHNSQFLDRKQKLIVFLFLSAGKMADSPADSTMSHAENHITILDSFEKLLDKKLWKPSCA